MLSNLTISFPDRFKLRCTMLVHVAVEVMMCLLVSRLDTSLFSIQTPFVM